MNVHNLSSGKPGTVEVILATPEQLFRSADGHYSRLGTLLRDAAFRRRVRVIVIDEAHFIHTTGQPLYGLNAFRAAYGRLDEIKALFGTNVPWLALTATAPLTIMKTIEKAVLRPSYLSIQLSLNRPNLMYACHQLAGSSDCFDNFKCFLTQPFDLEKQPRILIFVEDSSKAVRLALSTLR